MNVATAPHEIIQKDVWTAFIPLRLGYILVLSPSKIKGKRKSHHPTIHHPL